MPALREKLDGVVLALKKSDGYKWLYSYYPICGDEISTNTISTLAYAISNSLSYHPLLVVQRRAQSRPPPLYLPGA